jgi:hypothetical protein
MIVVDNNDYAFLLLLGCQESLIEPQIDLDLGIKFTTAIPKITIGSKVTPGPGVTVAYWFLVAVFPCVCEASMLRLLGMRATRSLS